MRAGRAYVELYTDDSKLNRGLASAQAKLRAFGAGVQAVGARFLALGGAMAAPIIAASKLFASTGDTLHKMAARTGVTTEALSELGFAAEQSGADLATVETGIKSMQKILLNAERGLTTATDSLSDLGLSLQDLKGLSPDKQFKLIADRLAQIPDPSRRAAMAMQVLGRSGQALLPMMQAGARGINELQAQAQKLGLTISTADAERAAEFTDQMNILSRVLKAGVFSAGSAVSGMLIDLAQRATNVVKTIGAWIKRNGEAIVTTLKVAGALLKMGAAAMVVGTACRIVAAGLGAIRVAMTFISAHPLVALAVAGAAVASLFVDLSAVMGNFTDEVEQTAEAVELSADAMRAESSAIAAKVKRLDELRNKQSKTNTEMAEAALLTGELTAAYPGLQNELRAVGKAADGAAKYMQALNQATAEAAKLALQKRIGEGDAAFKQLAEDAKAQQKLADEAARAAKVEAAGSMGGFKEHTRLVADKAQADADALWKKLHAQNASNVRNREILKGLTAAAQPVAPGVAIDDDAETEDGEDVNADLLRELADIRARAIENGLARELQLLQNGYAEKRALAEKNGQDLVTIEQMYREEVAQVRKRYADKEAEESRERVQRLSDEIAQGMDDVADFEAGVADDIARAEIDLMPDGLGKQMATLRLDKMKAMKEALALGADPARVERLFELKTQLTRQGAVDPAKLSVTGTFSAAAASRLGGGGGKQLDKLVDNTKETNRAVARVERAVERHAPQFT